MITGILILALMATSFLFSGLESALLAVTGARLRRHARKDDPSTLLLLGLAGNKAELLTVILLVTNACNVIAFGLLALHLTDRLGFWGIPLTLLIALPVYVLWVELIPKTLFRRYPYRLLKRFVWLLRALHLLFQPLLALGKFLFRGVVPTSVPNFESLDRGRAALRALTRSIHREGTLSPAEALMIQQALDFERVKVRDIMLPLHRVTAVPAAMPASSVLQLARDTAFDQFPVMAGNGDFVGLVRVFEILRTAPSDAPVSDFVRRLHRVRGGTRALVALQSLRRAKVELALIEDSRSRPVGIISSQDIVEALLRPF